MTETDVVKNKKTNMSKIVVILLLVLILLLLGTISFFVVRGNDATAIIEVFRKGDESIEYTMSLEEFVVNLKSDDKIKHYLKVSLALMYAEEDHGAIIESSISKIRDAIINDIRSRSYEEVLEDDNALIMKQSLVDGINVVLGEDIIKNVYITDIIIQ